MNYRSVQSPVWEVAVLWGSQSWAQAAFQAALQERDLPTMVYYPVPLHLQKAYARPEYPIGTFPVAEQLAKNVVSLPIHTEMQPDAIQYIVHTVHQTLSQISFA